MAECDNARAVITPSHHHRPLDSVAASTDAAQARVALSGRALALRRGGRWLLRDTSFELSAGEVLHLSGRNGAGKTTLLRALAGISRPVSGTVCWQGVPIETLSDTYAAQLLYLGHGDGLAGDLTPREHLLLACAGRTETRLSAVDEALVAVGLGPQRALPTRVLSAGQRRRVVLARLRLIPAALWLLDEPLAALDADAIELVGASLDTHLARGGCAVISSHQPLPARATRVLTLDLGHRMTRAVT